MFLIDTNVWIAQTFTAHPGYQVAVRALGQATPTQPAVFCRATQQSFLRVASTPAILKIYGVTGMTNEDALRLLEQLMISPAVAFHSEPAQIEPLWHRLAGLKSAAPKVWMDAYLAAFAIVDRLTMVTLDSDFQQFQSAGLSLQLLQVP